MTLTRPRPYFLSSKRLQSRPKDQDYDLIDYIATYMEVKMLQSPFT